MDGRDPTIPFSPFTGKTGKIMQYATTAANNGSQAVSVSVSVEASLWKAGAKFEAGPVSAEANLNAGKVAVKASTDNLSASGTIAEANIKISAGDGVSAQANASVGTAKVSVDGNSNVKTETTIASGSARANVDERYVKVDNTATVSVGAQIGHVKAEVSTKLDKVAKWFVATVSAIGEMITPEIKVPDEIKH